MSKLKKLVSNPRLFVEDALRKRLDGPTGPASHPGPAADRPAPGRAEHLDPEGFMAHVLDVIPSDHAAQVTGQALMEAHLKTLSKPYVVDLGAGAGTAVDWMRQANAHLEYTGVDIEWSPQVEKRQRSDAEFRTYDGVHLPFEDASVDVMYSNQVLEHVRYPLELLRDVKRVLKSDGQFIGSVSQMEPYHSFSIYNFTIYGVKSVFEEAGLIVTAIRPSIDAVSLIGWWRHRAERSQRAAGWRSESTLNREIDQEARARHWTVQRTNFEKLRYAGQLVFVAQPTPP